MRHNQNSPKIPPAWSLTKGAIEIEVCNLSAFNLLAAAVLQSVDRAHCPVIRLYRALGRGNFQLSEC
jgi:hypothetical protein